MPKGVEHLVPASLADVVSNDRDAIGVVLAVDGRLEAVDVYPNHELLEKLYPLLVHSYGMQAELLHGEEDQQALAAADLPGVLRDGAQKSERTRPADARNAVHVRELEGNRYQCDTVYEGRVVHWQLLTKNGAPKEGGRPGVRQRLLGNDW
jgi:ARG/rhodanese/phosphatase superfamily protein